MENAVLSAILNRRSIRAYKPEQITDEQLEAILNAGLAAPSARNSQPWHFTAVQNQEMLTRINEAFRTQMLKEADDAARAHFGSDAYSVFFHAPTVIFISCPPTAGMKYAETDTGIAIENMALAAYSLGLGSVILGMPRFAFEGPEGDALRSALSFPEGYDYCLSIAIGYPAATKEAHPAQPDRVTILR